MTNDITKQRPKTGRTLREDSSVINTADLQALNTTVVTTTPLIIDAVYTGATLDTLSIFPVPAMAFAYAQSDVASATLGFLIEQSDNANMSSPSTIVSATASAGALTALAPTAITKRYVRVRYTNAHANPQTTFILLFGYTSGTENVTTITGSVTATLSSQAFTNAILTAVEDNITHTLGVQIKGVRPAAAGCYAHRATLVAPDLVGAVATAPTVPTFADATANPSSALTNVAYKAAYVVRNGMGVTLASALATVTPTNGHMVRVTIPAAWGSALSDTDLIYEIFMSTDAAPLHIATFTGAQLAASGTSNHGCYVITAETPVTTAADARAAWAVDIGCVGTGIATTNAMFATSTAYSQATIAGLTPVATTGYNNADVFVDATPTAYSVGAAAPSLTLIPVYLNDKQTANYHVGAPIVMNILGGAGQSFRQLYNLTTNGASVMILVGSIANVTVNRIDITPTSVV